MKKKQNNKIDIKTELKMMRDPEDNELVFWYNHRGEIVTDFNDDSIINYPEDLVSYRDIGDLINRVYKKAYNDAIRDFVGED